MIDDFCANPNVLVPFASFESHYMLNHCFVREGELLDGVAKLRKNMKVRIINGRCDFICRPITAWKLAKTMRAFGMEDVQVKFVNGWGHHDSEPPVGLEMVLATNKLKAQDGGYPLN